MSEWYHTGNDDLDKWIDRNYEVIETAMIVAFGGLFDTEYRKRFGVMPFKHILLYLGSKMASDAIGLMFSRMVDPEGGGARWAEFQDRLYDWYGLEEYEIFDVGLGMFPNSLQLTGILAESTVMIGKHYGSKLPETSGIFSGHMAGRVLNAPAVNPFFLGEQILYYGNPSYRVGTGMGD